MFKDEQCTYQPEGHIECVKMFHEGSLKSR